MRHGGWREKAERLQLRLLQFGFREAGAGEGQEEGVGLGDRGGVTREEGAGGGLFICSAVLCPEAERERQKQLGGEKATLPGALLVLLP